TNTYDDYGRLLTRKTPGDSSGTQFNTTQNSYIPTGKTSSELTTSKLPFSTTLPSGKQTTFEYDANWRKTKVIQAPNSPTEIATTQYIYDQGSPRSDGSTNIGLLTSTIDPRFNTTTYTYDRRDRQNSITDALMHTTSFVFDFHGNKTQETHANGELIEFDQYDPMNRLLHKRTHRDATHIDEVSMTYDSAGNLATQRDENNNLYTYTYDKMNRPLTMNYP